LTAPEAFERDFEMLEVVFIFSFSFAELELEDFPDLSTFWSIDPARCGYIRLGLPCVSIL
jgi:hypothetical protein